MSMGRLKVDPIFSDRMVLQRNVKVPVWGTGTDGERIEVECRGIRAETVVSDGRWFATLPPMEAGGPFVLTVRSDSGAVSSFEDVRFGDVWLAGGQSNMAWPLKDAADAEAEIARADDPGLRYYEVPKVAYEDGSEPESSWRVCRPDNAGDFSAVAYHFARRLRRELDVPIGIVGCNFGATSAACWMAEERLRGDAVLRVYLDEYEEQVRDFDWAAYEREEKRFQDDFAAYMARAEAGKTGDELGVLPWPPPMSPRSFMRPNGLYGTMLRKAVPYGIKGFIYYQGEADAPKAALYDKLLEALIANWRSDWGDESLPFLFVQLAAFGCDGNPGGEDWALLRESQFLVSERVPNTGMAVSLDCGEEHDIHPKDKKTVGERLALVALERVYGRDVQSSGPVWKGMKTDGDRAVLEFAFAGERLVARGGGELKGFEAAGADGEYVPALAEIDGDKVVVRAPGVPIPARVRYGWANYTEANLANASGLPAVPFRTDRPGRGERPTS
ncbi:sialate O-acetylesterase [Cohnella thermotolerans]|uniref:sialate O-acetylesterase n=1 Tax=Cohnella thermotolerans TaxID=329858 RepID=UPI0003F6C563|nr:sialate O-acetylesterase [Cohnella thermotolerans]